jgi:hypothetical protein
MKNKLLIPVAVVMIAGAIYFGAVSIQAQSTSANDPQTSLIQKFAKKFGLKESDVQTVFDEERTTRQAEMQTRYEEQLTQYVKDGKITEAQKQLIINKHKELQTANQTERTDMRDLTPEQRRTQMETKREELETWATQNGIDPQYIGGFGGRGCGGMRGFGR